MIIRLAAVAALLFWVCGCTGHATPSHNPYKGVSLTSASYPSRVTFSIIAEGKPVTITRMIRMHEYTYGHWCDPKKAWTQGVVWVHERLPSGADIYLKLPEHNHSGRNPKSEAWKLGSVYYIKDPIGREVIEEYTEYNAPDRFAEDVNVVWSSGKVKYDKMEKPVPKYDTNDFYLVSSDSYYLRKAEIPYSSACYRVSYVEEIDPSYHEGLARFLSTLEKKTILTQDQMVAAVEGLSAIVPPLERPGDIYHITPLTLQGKTFTLQPNKSGIRIHTKDSDFVATGEREFIYKSDELVTAWLTDKSVLLFGTVYPAPELSGNKYLYVPETGKLYRLRVFVTQYHFSEKPL